MNVHTTGIDWESVGTIIGGFAAFATLILIIIWRVTGAVRREIAESVTHLAEILNSRLETKDTVARLTTRVAVLEERDKRERRR